MGDPELLHLFATRRDEHAFTRLVERYSATVFGAALRKTGDHAAAQDISQTVFAVLARKASDLAGHPALGGWLYRAAVLESSKYYRTESRRLKHLEKYAENREISGSGAPEVNGSDLRESIDDAISALPDRDREVVVLRYFEDLEFGEIAERTGGREPALRMRLSRALKRLGKKLSKETSAVSGCIAIAGTEAAAAVPESFVASTSAAAIQAAPTLLTTTLTTHTLETMATAKLKLTAVAAGVTALAAIPIGTQWQANSALKTELAAQQLRVDELETALASATASIVKAEDPPVEKIAAAAAQDSSDFSDTPSASTASSGAPSNMNSLKSLFDNPMMVETMKQQIKAQFGEIYSQFFGGLGFADDEIEVLTDLLIERKIAEAKAAMEVVGADKETREAALAEARVPINEKLDELLSPSDAKDLAEVERTINERHQVSMISSQLSSGEHPLTSEQESRLLDVMVAAKAKSDTGDDMEHFWTPEEAPDKMDEMATYHAGIAEDAASFLSAEQLVALEATQQHFRALMKMAADMSGQ